MFSNEANLVVRSRRFCERLELHSLRFLISSCCLFSVFVLVVRQVSCEIRVLTWAVRAST